jgi:hypothetical protein
VRTVRRSVSVPVSCAGTQGQSCADSITLSRAGRYVFERGRPTSEQPRSALALAGLV